MASRFAVVYALTYGPAAGLTAKGQITHTTVDTREQAEEIAAALNTPEGMARLHSEIAARPEYASPELIHTTPAEVAEIPD